MRPPSHLRAIALAACTLAALPASSQMHKVQKPGSVTRAIAVYEWTGPLLKPTAGRLIPVTLYINGELQDAGIFQPQPVPFALLPGNQYILQNAGIPQALFDLRTAAKQPDADTGNIDGWWAFGNILADTPPPVHKLPASKHIPSITTSRGDIPGANTDSSDNNRSENSPDPDRPTLRRRSNTGTVKPSSPTAQPDSSTIPPDDSGRPTLKRRSAPTPASTASSDSQQRSTSAVADDPDRPLLHRGVPPNGGPTESDDTKELAKLAGLPKDLHQLVAVSDATDRPEHDFARPWTDPTEEKLITSQLEAIARALLASYNPLAQLPANDPRSGHLVGQAQGDGDPVAPSGGPFFSPSQASTDPASANPASTNSTPSAPHHPTTPAARRRAALAKAAAARTAAARQKSLANLPLDGEDLRAFTLSYGAEPTFVFSAHITAPTPAAPIAPHTPNRPSHSAFATSTAANNSSTAATSTLNPTTTVPTSTAILGPTPGTVRYITLVAQRDTFGHLQIALASVTDSVHLDREPWMRLVGPVDVEASNRASLLFELREQGSRQFALYRVLNGHADPLFSTGTTQ